MNNANILNPTSALRHEGQLLSSVASSTVTGSIALRATKQALLRLCNQPSPASSPQ